ncbi:MAG: glucose-1-phosphate adenylyltransferase [Anaerovibrio sp.]|uniref:glucose-1-phosphate adenylyltransferase n=1 Tax=uncultured Anaerovibrio sp. TaxID=361586 RepID=UPI0025D003E4|nr:glucose-1-phosphate adenylyltransferase [uncultured Anaerovibrio sp.]MBQ3853975.1 glucose-1-phosphate adenylyltransferase [Anaerovibrio sp.]
MSKTKCVAMILAGGQGSRLGALTKNIAKPAVPFGGKYRIIDFPLSNCTNSGIEKVGVLTQYRPLELHSYLGTGDTWDLDKSDGGVFILPPYARDKGADWYKGTADAIYQNLNFIDMVDPEYVLVLSGDHIYTMDYAKMLAAHRANKADVTIGVFEVPWEEAPRFGILNTDKKDGRIVEFEEKPSKPKSNLASMGIYIFNREFLDKYLKTDASDETSSHDFGKNIIPNMLKNQARIFSYKFEGYWKDVGTIESLWQANMDLLQDEPPFSINSSWNIYSANPSLPPHFVGADADISRSMINEGSMVLGTVSHSVLSAGVKVGKGAKVTNSVIMPFAVIEDNAVVDHAIVAQNSVISASAQVLGEPGAIAVVPEGETVEAADSGQQVS